VGSSTFHWQWPQHYQTTIRDGLPPWFMERPKPTLVPQRGEPDPAVRDLITKKLSKIRAWGYVQPGYVRALTSFFSVPKGEDDIRLVYNGTKSGLNDCLWAPWFRLPTVDQLLRSVVPGTYMADIDVGEMFLNFTMHERMQPYAGVDFTLYFPEELTKGRKLTLWERWVRCGMGFKSSPYNTGQAMLMADEFIRGSPSDPCNIFCYDTVILNLPGMVNYDPAKPWVLKFCTARGQIAPDFFVYVDDVRATGFTADVCWQVTRKIGYTYNYLGIQDAPRKRGGPSLEAGPWAGSTLFTSRGEVFVTVTMDRWKKAKSQVLWIYDTILLGQALCHKTLESYQGYLVYISHTYPSLVPYLKGIHLTLDSWRPHRDADGWKLSDRAITTALLNTHLQQDPLPVAGAPSHVTPVPQFLADINALQQLFYPATPPLRRARPSSTAVALYGFADASGTGFGSTFTTNIGLHYRHGQWSSEYSKKSSNYRELGNLVLSLEEATQQGHLKACELFMFTDNSTAESTFHRGTSSTQTLFQLVLRVRTLQMHHDLALHVVHVAGKRMQAQGTDSLSRGALDMGVLLGADMLSFVPLHLSALERSSELQPWVMSWWGSHPLTWLQPYDWFHSGHQLGSFAWVPPPATAAVCLEQVATAIHKRPHSTHVILIPRLLTAVWCKLLGKICDLSFTVPLGSTPWSHTLFEPLIVGIYLPLSRHRPWRLRGTSLLDDVAQHLSRVPTSDFNWGGDILREFHGKARSLDALSTSMAREVLSGK